MTDLATGKDHVNTVRLNGGRPAVLYKPAAAWTLSASVDRHSNSQPDIVAMQADPTTLVPIYGERIGLSNLVQSANLRYTVSQATVDWEGPIKVTSSTGYSDFKWRNVGDATGTYQAVSPFFLSYSGIGSSLDSSTNKFTEELRVTAPSGEHFEWLVGGFYTHERSIYVSDILGFLDRNKLATGTVAGVPLADILLATNKVSYREHAAFGDLTWHLTSTLDATVGARYSSNSQDRDTQAYGNLEPVLRALRSGQREAGNPRRERVDGRLQCALEAHRQRHVLRSRGSRLSSWRRPVPRPARSQLSHAVSVRHGVELRSGCEGQRPRRRAAG
jgi:iron complex outermembrane recepter protein